MASLKVLALTRYGRLGASSRVRTLQYLPLLAASGIDLHVEPLIGDEALRRRYKRGRHGTVSLVRSYLRRATDLMRRHQYDVIWIEKEALPWWPFWIESRLLRDARYIVDYDDAVFHYYDRNPRSWVRFLYGKRLDKLMSGARIVVAGNDYLAERATSAGAPRIELVPTVVDLQRYRVSETKVSRETPPRIVWIGSPSTVRYLGLLARPLQILSERHQFIFRVIGGDAPVIPGVRTEQVAWSEDTEVEAIMSCSIGVMPLLDTPWERGKCGYKIIQYMACGLPVVASPVGVNSRIIDEGKSGLLADSDQAWVNSLEDLLLNPDKRNEMGMVGRKKVEERYSMQVQLPRLIRILSEAASN